MDFPCMSDNETVNEEGMFLNPLAWMTLVVRDDQTWCHWWRMASILHILL
jgi:hypothetical protein